METNQTNGATCVDDNTAVLPQKIHSNVENLFPPTPLNGNLRTPSNPQVSLVIRFVIGTIYTWNEVVELLKLLFFQFVV